MQYAYILPRQNKHINTSGHEESLDKIKQEHDSSFISKKQSSIMGFLEKGTKHSQRKSPMTSSPSIKPQPKKQMTCYDGILPDASSEHT